MSAAASHTPIDIPVRTMGFEFPADLPRYWANGDPFETHMFHALSLTFPLGEQAFIDSVRHFADRITDPVLAEDVRAFIGQEMQHSREHDALNRWIESQGLPAKYVYDFLAARIAQTDREAPPIVRLAVTCALEHFTAIMAEAFLADESVLTGVDDRVKSLFIWHAIEETEHKSVAFDVFQHVGGSYKVRVTAMAYVTVEFIRNQAHFHRTLMVADGQGANVASWTRGMIKYWGPNGIFTKLLPAYLAYFRRDFHPWQHDNRALVAKWKGSLEARAKRVVTRTSRATT